VLAPLADNTEHSNLHIVGLEETAVMVGSGNRPMKIDAVFEQLLKSVPVTLPVKPVEESVVVKRLDIVPLLQVKV